MRRIFLLLPILCAAFFMEFGGISYSQWNGCNEGFCNTNSSGVAAPTWTATSAGSNEACGFPAVSCSVSITVNPGLVVLGIGGNTTGTTISGVVLCGVSLTQAATTGSFGSSYITDIWYGVVSCSGSQSVAIASSSGFALNNIYVGAGTLTNLVSSTPGTACNNSTASVSGNALACSSSIAIAANGFGIGFCWQGSPSPPTFANMTTGEQSSGTTMGSFVISDNASAGALTPNCQTLANFTNAGVVAAPWH